MDALKYLHLQMGLEGIGLAGENTIKRVKVVPGEELPLLLLAQLADQRLVAYYSESLSLDLQTRLHACTSSIQFPEIDPILDVLKLQDIRLEIGHYKTYFFPSANLSDSEVTRLSSHDPKTKAFGFDGFVEQVYAIEHDGRIISACVSVREDERCGEAWVYTDPAYRRKGLAKKVICTWAQSLISTRKVPFYSHKIDNLPSARLADALHLQPVFEEISITQAS